MPQDEQLAEQSVNDEARQPQPQEEQDDDNAPMVYRTPKDYRTSALRQREVLQAEGKVVILQSELPSHIPRQPDEPGADYAKRFTETMNGMIRRGVMILNDQTTADVSPDVFGIGGHEFDVGPKSGITKKEYREFSDWMGSDEAEEKGYEGVPERFRRFEVIKSEL